MHCCALPSIPTAKTAVQKYPDHPQTFVLDKEHFSLLNGREYVRKRRTSVDTIQSIDCTTSLITPLAYKWDLNSNSYPSTCELSAGEPPIVNAEGNTSTRSILNKVVGWFTAKRTETRNEADKCEKISVNNQAAPSISRSKRTSEDVHVTVLSHVEVIMVFDSVDKASIYERCMIEKRKTLYDGYVDDPVLDRNSIQKVVLFRRIPPGSQRLSDMALDTKALTAEAMKHPEEWFFIESDSASRLYPHELCEYFLKRTQSKRYESPVVPPPVDMPKTPSDEVDENQGPENTKIPDYLQETPTVDALKAEVKRKQSRKRGRPKTNPVGITPICESAGFICNAPKRSDDSCVKKSRIE